MGKGGHNLQQVETTSNNPTTENNTNDDSTDDNTNETRDNLSHLPTLNMIKKTIPADCFQPTVSESMYHVFKDLLFAAVLYVSIVYIETNFSYGWILLPLYWFAQGTVYTGIFVLGHDCGHGSFSSYSWFNDIMGTLLHTFILAPFYPWKLSHRKHHNNTSNIDKDEVFYPKRKSELSRCNDQMSSMPVIPGFGLPIGWFYYLLKGYCPRHVNHFNPFEPLFSAHLFGVLCSLVCYASWLLCLGYYAVNYGFLSLLSHHLIPVFIFAGYMVLITFLHHNDVDLPWYVNSEWNYVKGQLSTMDRHYGLVHGLIHNIGTHQIHHLFTSVPHYKLEKATKAFREAWPNLVHKKDDNLLLAFFKMFNIYEKQHVIDDDENFKVHYYKKSE